MAGRVRFGPDVQWLSDPKDYKLNADNLDSVYSAVQDYLPSIDRDSLAGDYTGIRYLHLYSI